MTTSDDEKARQHAEAIKLHLGGLGMGPAVERSLETFIRCALRDAYLAGVAAERARCVAALQAEAEALGVDAGTLRYLVDPTYAAEVHARNAAVRLTRDELREFAGLGPPAPDTP